MGRMDGGCLPEDVERRLATLRPVDVVAAVLSYQHGHTIEGVLRELDKGLRAHVPDGRALIVHSDAGSTDGTVEAAERVGGDLAILRLAHPASPAERAAPPFHGVPGADEAFRILARIAGAAGARALLLVGADLRAVPEGWVERLVRPVREGELDLVAPLFARHVLDGTLTTWLLYPLTRMLYGRAVRQLVPTELACSVELATRLAAGPGCGTPVTRALPLFLTTSASALGARLGEAWLGTRDAEPSPRRLELGDLMSEVLGGAFALAERYEEEWREAGPGAAPRLLGTPIAAPGPPPVVSQARMVGLFRQGLRDLVPIWEQALRAETLADLYPLGDLPPEEFRFSPELWARVACDFLLAYGFRVLHRDHLLRSLVPLYLGRVAALVGEVATGRPGTAERLMERQVQAFEEAKVDLVDRWRWGVR